MGEGKSQLICVHGRRGESGKREGDKEQGGRGKKEKERGQGTRWDSHGINGNGHRDFKGAMGFSCKFKSWGKGMGLINFTRARREMD